MVTNTYKEPYFYMALINKNWYNEDMEQPSFEWDKAKDTANLEKHGVSFFEAQEAFFDEARVIAEDQNHSQKEKRYFCFGKVNDGILTVRFTYRKNIIRIIGAGYWRKGRKVYEQENN